MPGLRLFLAAVAMTLGVAAGSRANAQTCDEIKKLSWDAAKTHIYLVQAISDGDVKKYGLKAILGGRVLGRHMQPESFEISSTEPWVLAPPFSPRQTLHWAWNALVEPVSGGRNTWEKAPLAVIEPMTAVDGPGAALWNAAPYDTFILGPYSLSPEARILIRDDLKADPAAVELLKTANVSTFTGPVRDAVAKELALVQQPPATSWRVPIIADLIWGAPPPPPPAKPEVWRVDAAGDGSRIMVYSAACTTGVSLTNRDAPTVFKAELVQRGVNWSPHVYSDIMTLEAQVTGGGRGRMPDAVPGGLHERLTSAAASEAESKWAIGRAAMDRPSWSVLCESVQLAKKVHARFRTSPTALELQRRLLAYAMYIDARTLIEPAKGLDVTRGQALAAKQYLNLYEARRFSVLKPLAEAACEAEPGLTAPWESYFAALRDGFPAGP